MECREKERSQTPAWLLETTMGWQRLGRLWRESQGTHSTQSCSPPALSPLGAAQPCHVPHSVTPSTGAARSSCSKEPELAAVGEPCTRGCQRAAWCQAR